MGVTDRTRLKKKIEDKKDREAFTRLFLRDNQEILRSSLEFPSTFLGLSFDKKGFF